MNFLTAILYVNLNFMRFYLTDIPPSTNKFCPVM